MRLIPVFSTWSYDHYNDPKLEHMIQCMIVDDKPLAIDILSDYVRKIPSLHLAASFQNPLEALDRVRQHGADLIFLDVQMPELTGVQFLALMERGPKVILTTAYSEYALQGYEHEVADYLLKPISFERFYKAVDKASRLCQASDVTKTQMGEKAVESLFVKTEYKIIRVPLDAIQFLEARQNYVAIHTKSEKILTLQNLKAIHAKLPEQRFQRVHKSYIVALDQIEWIEKGHIKIGKAFIPLGEHFRDALMNRISLK